MIRDPFNSLADSPVAPSGSAATVVPHDVQALPQVSKALYIGTGGDLVLRLVRGDDDVTFRNLADGSLLDVRAVAVRANGTTAADIVALF